MKNAAKCDKQCELQNSVNHRIFERTLRPLVFRWACLFECLEIIKPVRFHRRAGLDLGACRFAAAPLKCIGFGSLRELTPWALYNPRRLGTPRDVRVVEGP